MRIHRYERVSSTNDVARELAEQGAADGTVVLADEQTAGRGRLGRAWHSPAGANLYLSYLHRTSRTGGRLGGLTLDAAVATATAVEDLAGVRPRLRWPNDLLVGEAKLGGLLTELHTDAGGGAEAAVVVGLGLNVNLAADDFPDELRGLATSLRAVTGASWDRGALGELAARRIGEKLAGHEAVGGPDLAAYRARFTLADCEVRVDGPEESFRGTVRGLSDEGALRVERADGREELVWSGDVRRVDAAGGSDGGAGGGR